MGKFYAVKNGRKTGIFNNWKECEKQVKGYSRAEFKSFELKEDAIAYLNIKTKMNAKTSKKNIKNNFLEIYVDGSYNASNQVGGFGCVILKNDKVIHMISKAFQADVDDNTWNIAGEINATLTAVEWAMENKYKKVTIFYDYIGIEAWANGSWRTNTRTTWTYAQKMQRYKREIDIGFVKVKAHSGVEYNEKADELAKQAIENWLLANK